MSPVHKTPSFSHSAPPCVGGVRRVGCKSCTQVAGEGIVLQDFSVLHRLSEREEEDSFSFWGRMTIHEFLEEREEEEGQMLGEVGEVRRDSLAEEKAALKVRLGNSKTFLFPIKNV